MTDGDLEEILIEETAKYLAKLKATGEDVSFDDLLEIVKVEVPKDQFKSVFEDVVFWMNEQGYAKYSEAYSGPDDETIFSRCRLTESGFERFARFVDPEGTRQQTQQSTQISPSVVMNNVNFTNSNFLNAGHSSSLNVHQVIDQSVFTQTLNEIEEAIDTLPLDEPERADAKTFLGTLRTYAGKALDATGKLVASALSTLLTAAGSTLGKSLLVACGMPVL
ncbi:hypothetical protein WH297_12790 [Ochrobactrum vermis]|uniref:Uncharacterized protein n=1 Tax=Ochrobactrum vermis TaxID=1827297 RepID=A0ABU8PEC1_9HYPH|nr:hypothetical protein [Ochrobactrum vermis]PQZ30909.1 hypothetical protein CQZ93_12985 [Ochrobactrum vermis]